MPSRTEHLAKLKLCTPPAWMTSGAVVREVINGSYAYGVSNDNSDVDVYGICVPPKGFVFPHTEGYVVGFDKNIPTFETYQEHAILDKSGHGGKGIEYDLNIFGIVKYFMLAADNNPNIIDSLFVPAHCVLHSTQVGNMIHDNRHLFIHKGMWHKFKGYAYSQLHKMNIKTPQPGSKRAADIEKHGFDCKFAYHVVRLLDEAEQALTTGTIDLTHDAERLKAIRRGEWTEEQIRKFFTEKEASLEAAYASSQLPRKPDYDKLRTVLLECLEHHYGSIQDAFHDPGIERKILTEIKQLCEKAGI